MLYFAFSLRFVIALQRHCVFGNEFGNRKSPKLTQWNKVLSKKILLADQKSFNLHGEKFLYQGCNQPAKLMGLNCYIFGDALVKAYNQWWI